MNNLNANIEGVTRLVRSEILRRIKAQLDTGARKYNNFERTQEALSILAQRIKDDGFNPDAIVAWSSENGHWSGSEIVGKAFAKILGRPLFMIEISEHGETRKIMKMCSTPRSFKNFLIVDDAGFSGTTMKLFKDAFQEKSAKIITRSAVLSCRNPVAKYIDYYADTHQFDDIFFPWGWARTINKFYDLLQSLGTRDRRWLERIVQGSSLHTFLVRGQQCNVDILSNLDLAEKTFFKFEEQQKFDTMIYVTSGVASIQVEDTKGFFIKNEYLFLPRIIPYVLELSPNASVVRILV